MRTFRKLLVGAALCASLATASGAQAGVLFSDTFDSENGGASSLNYNSFSQWTVTGQVDLVREPDYGIGCQDGGSCVDLDGSSGPGSMLSQLINFSAGELVTVSYDRSGNQRDGNSDSLNFALLFFSPTDLAGLGTLSGFPSSPASLGAFANVTSVSFGETVAGNSPWTTFSLAFTATEAGSLQLSFGTSSRDNIGPLLDNVLVTSAVVPEPASWALMIGGFGFAGAALRRRRAVVA